MSRVGFAHIELTSKSEVVASGDTVNLPFNRKRPSTLDDLFSRNRDWTAAIADSGYEPEDTPPNILWFGCIDAAVSETCLTLTLPGAIITHRNFGNLFQANDLNARAALAHARTQSDNIYILVVGHDNCQAIQLAKDVVAGVPNIPNDITSWIQPLIVLVNDNPDATVAELSRLNVNQQVENIRRLLIGNIDGAGTFAASTSGVVLGNVSGANASGPTGGLHV